ncbi:MAG: cytidylate kinase family protein [Clostridiaceae bacterium]|nr:cytidylate kinase family protein [Clostridiaceae bacterium]
MHITIAGKLGSGKSTICKILQRDHGFEIYSTGAVQREVAKEMGISTLELNQRMLSDPALDHVIDDAVAKLSRERRDDAIIFDSRMAWHFAERSFKIFVIVDPLIAAQRVMLNPRGSEETYRDVYDARDKLLERGLVENARFRDIYHVDNLDYHNYDLIIDTSFATPESICKTIYDCFTAYSTHPWQGTRMMLSPRTLYPTLPLEKMDDSPAIEAAYSDNRHFLICGHKAVFRALQEKEDFVCARLLPDGTAVTPLSPDQLAAYEKAYATSYTQK